MEKVNYLPLGSLVIVKGGFRKTLVIARGLMTNIGDEQSFFDYGGCMYPEGLVGDQVMYFNNEDIDQVVFEGYHDDENNIIVKNINDWLAKNECQRGNPLKLKEKIEKQKQEIGG